MARAEAAKPSVARQLSFSRLRLPRRAAITGHARLIAEPAYQRLLAAEPFLRKLIPILIVIFLMIVGAARFIELYQLKIEREYDARESLGMIASVLSTALEKNGAAISADKRNDVLNLVADALPPSAAGDGRRIYVTDGDGMIVATSPRDPAMEDMPLVRVIGEAQPLTIFGARAGVLEIGLVDGTQALATVHNLDNGLGSVALVQPIANAYDGWRGDVSLNVAIFTGTSAILLVILYGYFAQSTRAAEADRIYSETQQRFETALARGRCGLLDD